jgi:hypothetical protein
MLIIGGSLRNRTGVLCRFIAPARQVPIEFLAKQSRDPLAGRNHSDQVFIGVVIS